MKPGSNVYEDLSPCSQDIDKLIQYLCFGLYGKLGVFGVFVISRIAWL